MTAKPNPCPAFHQSPTLHQSPAPNPHSALTPRFARNPPQTLSQPAARPFHFGTNIPGGSGGQAAPRRGPHKPTVAQ